LPAIYALRNGIVAHKLFNANDPLALTRYQQGALAVGLGSAFWGLFWIPLRYLENAGLPSLIAVATVLCLGGVAALVVCLYHGALGELKTPSAWFIGITMGLSTVFYFYGVMTSDVIRVTFLFYLLPVWATLAARIIYGQRIGLLQAIVIFIALIGLWLLLDGDKRLPLPTNAGDWCGLAAGLTWGTSLALLNGKTWASPSVHCLCTFFTGALIALLAYFLLSLNNNTQWIQSLSNPLVLIVAASFGAIIVLPSMMGQVWGAGILPAPSAALLTMSEIIVATLSTFLLTGTELSGTSALGALVILTSVLADIYLKRNTLSST